MKFKKEKIIIVLVVVIFISFAVLSAQNLVGSYNLENGSISHVAVKDNYAFIAANDLGLRVIDLSDVTSPKEIGYYDTPGEALRVFLYEKYAFIADGSGGLRIIDISNPSSLKEVGAYDKYNSAWGDEFKQLWKVKVSGKYAFLADYLSGLIIVDISDPSSPVEVSAYPEGIGGIESIGIFENYAIVGTTDIGLIKVINFSNPSNPTVVDSVKVKGFRCSDLKVSGNYAFVAAAEAGLQIFDLSNPSSLREIVIDNYTSQDLALTVEIVGNYVLLTQMSNIDIFDISNLPNVKKVTSLLSPEDTRYATIYKNYLLVASGFNGLKIFELPAEIANIRNKHSITKERAVSKPISITKKLFIESKDRFSLNQSSNFTIYDLIGRKIDYKYNFQQSITKGCYFLK